MSDPFQTLVSDAQGFLRDLSAENNRDWFKANKARYEDQLKAPALHLGDQVAHDLSNMLGLPVTPKLFRAHRDVRFSKDKTPYHTHLHMLWNVQGTGRPGYFFGIAPDYVVAGGGIMTFEKDALDNWRRAMDGPQGETMQNALDKAMQAGARMDPPALKRVPAPYAGDHPRGDLLRRKGCTLWVDLPPGEHTTPGAALSSAFALIRPVMDQLAAL